MCVSCENEEKQQTTSGDSNVSVSFFDLYDNAQDTSFTVSGTGAWSIAVCETCEWISIDPTSGTGETKINMSLTANTDETDVRIGYVLVSSGARTDTVTVVQTPSIIKVSPGSFTLADNIGGISKTVIITGTVKWTTESSADWLSITPRNGSVGKTSATVTAKENTDSGERTGSIRIKTDLRDELITVVQKKTDRFIISTDTLELSDKGSYRYIRISSGTEWTATLDADWLTIEKTSGSAGSELLKVSATENTSNAERAANITFTANGETKSLHVTQGKTGDYWNDNDVKIVRKHTVGNGVPVVIVGDGFDRQDLKKGGWWEMWATRLAEKHFLEVELIRDLQNYLDIYILMSESQERGINYAPYTKTKTKYNASSSEDWSGAINAAIEAVNRNRTEANNAQTASWDNISVMFMANSAYAGNASDPLSRMGVDEQSYDYWAVHEFAGHILTNVPDLYYGSGDGNTLTEQKKQDLDNSHAAGLEWFVDYESDPATVVWKDFIGADGYTGMPTGAPYFNESDNIGVYGTGYQANTWHNELYGPSRKTSMREWYLCFDVGTRFHMWNTIKRLAGEYGARPAYPDFDLTASLAAFKAYDKNRTRCDCRWGKYTGALKGNDEGTPYLWTKYDASGKITRKGNYDRFWRALWPVANASSDK
jgi:hypothetical protein